MKKLLIFFSVVVFITSCCNIECFPQDPPDLFENVDVNCSFTIPDYRHNFTFSDNCAIKDTVQLPAPGTVVSIITSPIVTVEIIVRDVSDNVASVNFTVTLIDTVPPTITPNAIIVGVFDEYEQVGGNKLRATPIIMRGFGMIQELASYHKGYDDAKMIMALYSDTDGKPDKLMATTGEVQMSQDEGWQVEPVLGPIQLNEGQPLWLAFITDQSTENQGIGASPVEYMSDVSAASGMYTGSMPLEFGESTQWAWEHSIHMRYISTQTKPVEILAQQYKEVERYVTQQIGDYVEEFDWSTAAIDTVFAMPKCIPEGSIIE